MRRNLQTYAPKWNCRHKLKVWIYSLLLLLILSLNSVMERLHWYCTQIFSRLFSTFFSLCLAQIRHPIAQESIFTSYSKYLFCSVIILENSLDSLFQEGLLEYVSCCFTCWMPDWCKTSPYIWSLVAPSFNHI